jgi:Rrf2 family protein
MSTDVDAWQTSRVSRAGEAMKLQVSTRLAIFALLELAEKPDRQLPVAEIGDRFGASSHHLAKVMHVLGRAGLVRSARGAGGGYQFSGNPRRTTLLDIVSMFEESVSAGSDGAAEDRTDAGRALRQILAEIDQISQATLGSITIATALKLMERQRLRANRSPRRPASPQRPASRRRNAGSASSSAR